jgi:putative oxidoreductase
MSAVPTEALPSPKPFIPIAAPLYQWLEPYGYALFRIGYAAILIPHGWQKLFGTVPSAAGKLVAPWNLPADWSTALGSLELFGGLLLALGLLTRPVALLFLIELLCITFAVPRDAAWWLKGVTEHYTLLLALLALCLVYRGGGYYSVDRMIGKEF